MKLSWIHGRQRVWYTKQWRWHHHHLNTVAVKSLLTLLNGRGKGGDPEPQEPKLVCKEGCVCVVLVHGFWPMVPHEPQTGTNHNFPGLCLLHQWSTVAFHIVFLSFILSPQQHPCENRLSWEVVKGSWSPVRLPWLSEGFECRPSSQVLVLLSKH